MKSRVALLVLVLFSVGATACGGVSKRTSSASQVSSNAATTGSVPATTASTTPTESEFPLDDDQDNDNPSKSQYDADDDPVLYLGHAASAADRQGIAHLVKRYYGVAAAGDGAAACSLIYSSLAESVPEDYGQSPGPPSLRGKTCAVVVSKLLKQHRQSLVADRASLTVTRVRVSGSSGLALLRFGTKTERRVLVCREGGVWRMDVLLDIGVP
jgi:hypothetical protein